MKPKPSCRKKGAQQRVEAIQQGMKGEGDEPGTWLTCLPGTHGLSVSYTHGRSRYNA